MIDWLFGLVPWWTTHLTFIAGFVGVVATLFKFRALIALVPYAGPLLVWGVERLWAFLKFVGHGLFGIVTGKQASPAQGAANITAVIVLMMAVAIGGIRAGVRLDAHLVKEAREDLDTRTKERDEAQALLTLWEKKHDEETRRGDAAIQAREIAERKTAAALAALAKSRGVRDGGSAALAKAGPQKAP